jgi:hypothetical protein
MIVLAVARRGNHGPGLSRPGRSIVAEARSGTSRQSFHVTLGCFNDQLAWSLNIELLLAPHTLHLSCGLLHSAAPAVRM